MSPRLVLILTAFSTLALPLRAHAQRDTTLTLPGLAAPVRVVTDRWGIPHIQAASLSDLYLAWGFITARDRLWQLELSRRAACGRLWEWFGNSTLRADGGAQLFDLAGHAERIWQHQRARPEVAEPLRRYTAGINAWIALCRSGRRPWPEEFARLSRQPSDWRPEDTVLLLLAEGALLDLDFPELNESPVIRDRGERWFEQRHRFEGDYIYDTIPDSAARRLYRRAAGSMPLGSTSTLLTNAARKHSASPAELIGATPGAPPLPAALLARARSAVEGWLGAAERGDERLASNEFAVGSRRSASHAPLLANDPHLELGSPGPFHVVHLSVRGQVEAIGAAVPGLPFIASGRNGDCAWGVTSLSEDVVDVYADTLSKDGKSVRWNGGWIRMRERPFDLRFRVLGVSLPAFGQVRRFTPHGPVLAIDRKRGVALSARWTGDTDSLELGLLLGIERSHTAKEVCARYRSMVTPGLNVAAADREGHVIYQAVGRVPRREYGLKPGVLQGDGRHEWSGFIPPDRMPAWEIPPGGFFVNANNRPVGLEYPESQPRFDWIHDRAARIAQRLAGAPSLTLEDLRSVQNDVYSRAAARMLPRLLRGAESLAVTLTPREREALDSLRHWDYQARRTRVAPTLFRGWYGAFVRRSRLEGLPGLAAAALDGRAPEALRSPGGETPERAALASLRALDLALDTLSAALGHDLSRWQYGHVHRARFPHALSDRIAGVRWETEPLPADGDNSSPAVAPSSLPWSTQFTHAPVWRLLVDLAVADSALGVIPPGNSGDRASGHTSDLARRWIDHGCVPLYLAWPRIEAAKESEITLEPAIR